MSDVQPRVLHLVRREPLVSASLCFAIGVALDGFLAAAVYYLPIVAIALSLDRRRGFYAGLLLLVAAGGLRSRAETRSYDHVDALLPRLRPVEVHGVVDSVPVFESRRFLFHVATDRIGVGSESVPLGARIRVVVYLQRDGDDLLAPRPGDVVRFLAELREEQVFRNPGSLRPANYQRTRSLHGLAVLKSARLLHVEKPSRAWNPADAVRRGTDRLSLYWPPEHPTAALLNALVWGDRSRLSPSFVLRSQSAGVYHLIVVSGMHFTFLLAVVGGAAAGLRLPLPVRMTLAGAAIVLLLLRVPFGASVARAAVVAACGVALHGCFRRGGGANLLGGAWMALLAYRPALLFDAGLQFSLVCCVVLVRVAPVIRKGVVEPVAAGWNRCWTSTLDVRTESPSIDARRLRFRLEALLERQRALIPLYWLIRWPVSLFWVVCGWAVLGFLIQNETLLLSTFYANLAPGPALVANMALIPMTSVLMLLGVILSLSTFPLPWLATVAESLSGISYSSIEYFDSWSLRDHPQAPYWMLAVLALIAGLQFLFRSASVQRGLLVGLLALNSGWYLVPYRPVRPGVYFLDVGQGDCAVLLNAAGHALLIDAGTLPPLPESGAGDPAGDVFLARSVISRALWAVGARKILAIFVSHLHADHVSAVPRLAWNFEADRVVLSSLAGRSPALQRLAGSLPLNTQVRLIDTPYQEVIGGFQVEMLHPDYSWYPRSVNATSMVLRIRSGSQTFLFTGDMERGQEEALAGRVGELEILKVAHHGSLSSTSGRWLDEVHPRLAVISVGRRNRFGHPHRTVLHRLRERGIEVRRTDLEGGIYLPRR